jgi:hypothetical protein
MGFAEPKKASPSPCEIFVLWSEHRFERVVQAEREVAFAAERLQTLQ